MVHSRVKHLSLIAVVFVWNSVEYILDCININMVAICTKNFRKKTHIFYHSWFFYWNILVLFIINSMNSSQWKVFAFQQGAFFHHLHTSLFSFLFSLICLYTKTPLAVKILSPVACRRICKKQKKNVFIYCLIVCILLVVKARPSRVQITERIVCFVIIQQREYLSVVIRIEICLNI